MDSIDNQENLDLLSVGDSTMDVYMSPSETETFCEINSKECLICFSYGDKIPVKSIDFSVGGNAANNAVGTKRLGVSVGLVSTLGTDVTGENILKTLTAEKVDLTFTRQEPNSVSNYSTVVNYQGERTIFTYHAPRTYEFPNNLPKTSWVYLTSMGENFEQFYKNFSGWVKQNPEVKLVFNPGSRQLRAGVDALRDVLTSTHLIYVNRKEAEKMTNFGDSANREKDLLKALSGLGPKMCVITDGNNGSFVYDGEKFLRSGVMPVDAYERTGAGDSFGSGCLAALIKGKSFEEALLWGTVNSASVIGYIGPQKGLLKEDEMGVWIERAKSSNVKVESF